MTTTIPEKTIRVGRLNDSAELVELNYKWFKLNLVNINDGFLSVIYDLSFFEKIIRNEDLMVFTKDNEIVGYVLVNTVITTDHIDIVKDDYYSIRPENKFLKIAFSYQILIDKELQGTGLFIEAQKEYINYFKIKYDVLVSTVSRSNLRSIAAHKKAGWKFFDKAINYFIIELLL